MSNVDIQVYDSFNPPGAPTLTIVGSDGSALVTIRRDTGEIEYGEGYEPDDAARVFWDAFSTLPTENERLREALRDACERLRRRGANEWADSIEGALLSDKRGADG